MSKHERTPPAQGDFVGGAQGGGRPRGAEGHGGWHTTSAYGGGGHGGAEGDAAREIASLMEDPQMVRARGPAPKNYRRSDERIREDICEHLTRDERVDSSEVTVDVREGVVTLEGTVPERHMKHMIEDAAADTRGVEDVDNRIRVARGQAESVQSPAQVDRREAQDDPLVRQLADYGF